MTSPPCRSNPPPSQPAGPDKRLAYLPDASTPLGAMLYATIGGLIACLIMNVLSHIQVAISWH